MVKEEEPDVGIDDWETADLDDITKLVQQQQKKATTIEDEEDAEEEDDRKDKGKGKVEENKNRDGGAVKMLNKRKIDNIVFNETTIPDEGIRKAIVCILGHVDVGKTKLLDKIRRTNVQEGEAGGITQQIGATYFPRTTLEEQVSKVKGKIDIDLKLPGLLIIDTPGHESFTNLRSRGSSLCDLAILVVDLVHGLEKQTLESIQLLKQRKTPFVVALNKIDRCYEWKSKEFNNIQDSLAMQEEHTKNEFEDRTQKAQVQFAGECVNSEIYWRNTSLEDTVSLVPTSAITGEGIPDLLAYIAKMSQDMPDRLAVKKDEFRCTVLEVKVIEGHGTTIDVVLVNGVLRVGDTIVVSGFNGPIITTIRALLTPYPLKEMRVKGEYMHHKELWGAMGIKISAPNLEESVAGSELFKAETEDELEEFREAAAGEMGKIIEKYIDPDHKGVSVQASTLGALEALLEFLKQMKIPVCYINIGPIHKKDVMKSIKSLTSDNTYKEYQTILAFDVKVNPDA